MACNRVLRSWALLPAPSFILPHAGVRADDDDEAFKQYGVLKASNLYPLERAWRPSADEQFSRADKFFMNVSNMALWQCGKDLRLVWNEE